MPRGPGRSAVLAIICLLIVVAAAVGSRAVGLWDRDDSGESTDSRAAGPAVVEQDATPTSAPRFAPTLPPSPTPTSGPELAALASITEAEHEALRWTAEEPPDNPSPGFEKATGGSSERVCVDVQPGLSSNGAWRSGEFRAGNFDLYIEERSGNPEYSKLWWKPLHNAPDNLSGLTVRAVRLDGEGSLIPMEIFKFDQVAWTGSPPDVTPTPLPEGQHPDYFYPSGLELPTGGRWMLVATMGADWGCLVIELPESPTPAATAVEFTSVEFASIAEAEQEGATWPSESDPDVAPHLFMAPHRGSEERICVTVEPSPAELRNWRSGDFVAGNFNSYLERWPADHKYNQLYWQSLHSETSGLLVRGVLLDEPETTLQFSTEMYLVATHSADYEGSTRYYASAIGIPKPGRWLLVATSGPDWGCFILELPE